MLGWKAGGAARGGTSPRGALLIHANHATREVARGLAAGFCASHMFMDAGGSLARLMFDGYETET